MPPEVWARASSAPYNNVVGEDPQFVDPENGDYRPAPGSPAEKYGCQTFGRGGRDGPGRAPDPSSRGRAAHRDEIYVSGSVTEDTVWDADTVNVVGDVTVEDDVTLTIARGAYVEFQDYYRLDVAGTLRAEGGPDAKIIFTTDDPQDFTVDQSHTGCWNGIWFDRTLASNAESRLVYCIIEYSKSTGGGGGQYPYGGGAISVTDFSKLTIANCIIRNNVADYGGAFFLYRHANPRIVGNLIVDNHALVNAGAVYCAYSYPQMVNNTIVRNVIHNEDNPYIETCGVLNFIGKPVLANNIILGNDPMLWYMHSQLWNTKDYYTIYNNIEGYTGSGGNMDADPLFVDPAGGTFRLSSGSPCIDASDNDAVPDGVIKELDGNPRFVDDPCTDPDTGNGIPPIVDMGAYEYQPCAGDVDCDGDTDHTDLGALLGAWDSEPGDPNWNPDADLDGDGHVGHADLGILLAEWGCGT
jgi:hypothetical protein